MPITPAMRRRFAKHFNSLTLLFFALAALALAAPVLPDFGHRLIATLDSPPGIPGGDQGFFLWSLWWVGVAASRGIHPWFCDLQGAPHGVSLIYTTLSPFYGWLGIPLRAAGMSLVAVYNFWVVLSFALLPWFTMRVAREWGASRAASLLAGTLLWFPPFQRDHIGVLNLVSAWWVPAIYFCALRWHRTAAPRWVAAAALATVCCFYTDPNHTLVAMLLVALDGAWRLWAARSPALRRHDKIWFRLALAVGLGGIVYLSFDADLVLIVWLAFAGAITLALVRDLESQRLPTARRRIAGAALGAAIFALGVAPFFWIQLTDPRLKAAQLADESVWKFFWSTQPLSFVCNDAVAEWLCTHVKGWTMPTHFFQLRQGDMNVFPGYVFWVLAIAACAWGRPWRRGGRALLAFTGIFVLLSMGPFLRWGVENLEIPHWPNRGVFALPAVLCEGLPLLKGFRVWARMAQWGFFCAALLVALGWDRLLLRWGLARWRWGLGFVVAAAVIFERTPRPFLGSQLVRVPEFYATLAAAKQPLTLIEFPNNGGLFLYPQTVHGKKLANQYTSRRDLELEKRLQSNSFLWLDYAYQVDPALQNGMTPPPQTRERIRAGFAELAPDGMIVHPQALGAGDGAKIAAVAEGTLGLRPLFSAPDLILYGAPAGPLAQNYNGKKRAAQ